MKKVMDKINFAIIGLMVALPAFAAAPAQQDGMCQLVTKLGGLFKTLRTMAFIGAAFYIAGWAWEFIKGGEAKPDEVKKKGIALVVGFSILFLIGAILSFVLAAANPGGSLGCVGQSLQKW